jgi:hypothetical protein
MKSAAGAHHYFENDEAYYSAVDGKPYYGVRVQACKDGIGEPAMCFHLSQRMDAGCVTSGGTPKSYQSMGSNQMHYQRLVVKILGMEGIWNHNAYLDYAYAWWEGGRGPGHTKHLWSNGLSTNNCDNQRWNNFYTNPFGQEMWAAYKNFAPSGSPPPPPPPPPPPSALPAPQQLLN